MTTDTAKKRIRLDWLLYAGAAVLLIWVLYSATKNELARTPVRDATANLGQYGLVTIRFTTDPFPALPTGTVMMNFMPMDSRQRTVEIDQITFEYGPDGSEQAAGSGVTQLMPDGSGMYMAGAQFTYVGNWWVKANVTKGDVQADVRFTVYVEPAQ
jgi:hypothetical protein